MKKGGIPALLLIAAMFVGFTAGMLCGRHFADVPVTVNPIKTEYITPSAGAGQQNSVSTAGKVNINTASSVVLETLPGIGPVLADRIIAYRNENGLFSSIEELSKVEGIGSKTLLEILNLITVED